MSNAALEAERLRLASERAALPISSAKAALITAIRENDTLVIVGETGSGKSTQLPQYCVDAVRDSLRQQESRMNHSSDNVSARKTSRVLVGVTEPRRVAAQTLAARVAAEMGSAVGDLCGYAVRFDEKVSHRTRIKFVTDGMLLREAMVDRALTRYDAILLDEAHERTVHTDVLFGLLRGLQRTRERPLKLIVMSATLDADQFAAFFGARVIYVAGRQYPVRVLHSLEPLPDLLDACLRAVLQIHTDAQAAPGDVLVFLSGQEEIETLQSLLQTRVALMRPEHRQLQVCPLFAALDNATAMAAFAPPRDGYRKVVLATNIAEASVTIPGVAHVIDSGLAKVRGTQRNGLATLAVVPVARANATQRAGRAGRDGPGTCYRLYTEDFFSSMRETAPPEIQRIALGAIVLQLKAIGVADPLAFDFIDPPPRESIQSALLQLLALGALRPSDGTLTPLGERMCTLPLEPCYSRALLASSDFRCVADALTVIAVLSIDDRLFYAPHDRRHQADNVKRSFGTAGGDHFALLGAYRAFEEALGVESDIAAWCRQNFLSLRALKRAQVARRQLADMCARASIDTSPAANDDDPSALKQSFVAGFFQSAALLHVDGRTYRTIVERHEARIHPSSVLHGLRVRPRCVIYGDLVKTGTNAYMDTVMEVDIAWLQRAAPSYFGLASDSIVPTAIRQ
jgi:HrpA-like RNA helicase